MTKSELGDHAAYSRWASMRLLEACRGVSDEGLRRQVGCSFGSILDTLEHIFWGDLLWVSRLRGRARTTLNDPGERYSVAELERTWRVVLDDFEQFASSADPEALCRHRNLSGDYFEIPNWRIVLHVVNHATYHRGQVATMLRQLGHTPASTDLIVYYRERLAA
ncbi:MAG TPA: DinB family protein [Bryobacteraceae bacterium]|nr:DinB family protein [Bryobacteraceae bacterium]